MLVWRIRITSAAIEVRSVRGVLKRRLTDVAGIQRLPGKVIIAFKDGSRQNIPSIVGDLDAIANEIGRFRDQSVAGRGRPLPESQ